MTDPRKLANGRAAALPGAQTTARIAHREPVSLNVQLPRCNGPIQMLEADSAITFIIDNGSLKQVAVGIYEPGKTMGLMHLFSPEDARKMAESLVHLSLMLDAEAKAEADRKLADIGFASKPGADRPGFNPQVPKGGAA